ncbi:hypothetical protein MYAM1_001841 [Malassezia yamatoensis]|uniref:Mtf2-like C-terminal domain-containing protein n=1 Tax=Malassezia yamatoensis TaxID=253288 RepID=A0AAJ6CHS2_9BASI|nr:hypothetical protein MYAM1_001841 [Malassezia yamatoensis]
MLRISSSITPQSRVWTQIGRCSRSLSSKKQDDPAVNPWDELFAKSDVGGTPDEAPREAPTTLRSALYAQERPNTRSRSRQRTRGSTTPLTDAESDQFRRIFQLLEQDTHQNTPVQADFSDDSLEIFATRNALAPKKVTARGGGVGTRFHAAQEGAAASVAPEVMERAVDSVWEALHAQPDANAAWKWAESQIWGLNEETATYGPNTPYFAPALHMLLVTLRDRMRMPHAALAVVPQTRALGPTPYVLGCTAALYAEVVRTQWLCLRDIYAVLATVQEARHAGVLANVEEGELSRVVYSKREDAPLREQIERVRNEARKHVMRKRQDQHAEVDTLSDADQDVLRVVDELRQIAGHTARYGALPTSTHTKQPHKWNSGRPNRKQRPPPKVVPKLFPVDVNAILRS